MAHEKEKRGEAESRHGGGVFKWVWIVGVMLVLYVLSVGPAEQLAGHGLIPEHVLSAVYAPLGWLSNNVPIVARFFRWYGDVWGVTL